MVKDVEEFRAELYIERFSDLGIFQHGAVKVPPPRTGIGIAAQIAGGSLHNTTGHIAYDSWGAEIIALIVGDIRGEEPRAMRRVSLSPLNEEWAGTVRVDGVHPILQSTVGTGYGEGHAALRVVDAEHLPPFAEPGGYKAPMAGYVVGKIRNKSLPQIIGCTSIFALNT